MTADSRPEIKLSLFHKVVDAVSLAFALVSFGLVAINYGSLPESIPLHFNFSGKPDGYQAKLILWLIPAINLVVFLIFTRLAAKPWVLNYPVSITTENRERQYLLASHMIRSVKLVVGMLICFLVDSTIRVANGLVSHINPLMLWISIGLILSVIIVYLVSAFKYQ